jgi:hypothetical protein
MKTFRCLIVLRLLNFTCLFYFMLTSIFSLIKVLWSSLLTTMSCAMLAKLLDCDYNYRNPSLRLTTKAKRSQGRMPKKVWEWRLTLPNELSFWKLESHGTPEPSERDYRGQNTLHWRVFYIIGKLLKCRCLKWARMMHLDIWNTSYGKKKGWESNWQFDSQPQKVRNQPDFRVCRWSAIHRWKALNEKYNFSSDLIPIGGMSKKLWSRKVMGVRP